jgi:N6-L-threonylcarbamoyladenine synthase
MNILGIETSCDETAAAVIANGTIILSNIIASSQELHLKTGGIIPEVAAREQVKCIIPIINRAIEQSESRTIDALAVTIGPGLIGSLLVGVETAKTLAFLWNKPIVPVNHLMAHVYANWLRPQDLGELREPRRLEEQHPIAPSSSYSPSPLLPLSFPLIVLIASGGHTELILMKDHGKHQWLGGTRDDAAGEAFDKIARLLGLGYPGGPVIAATASNNQRLMTNDQIKLPRPMIDSEDFDFSFSGLKTAVLREVIEQKKNQYNDLNHCTTPKLNLPASLIGTLAYETQEAICDVLVEKTMRAKEKYKVKDVLLAGGVAANSRLRQKFQSAFEKSNHATIHLFIPPPTLCTDNAAGVASCAYFNFKPVSWEKIQALPSLGL